MSHFHLADYLVMVAMLVVSMATGLYFAVVGCRQNTVEEYLMAGRQMNAFPVAFSTFVTWMSGISFLGDPVECYKYGAIYFFMVLGQVISAGTAAPLVAKIHDLKIVSVYEFLETRYSRSLRIINSVCNIINLTLWLGIATYGPALGLSQASGIPVWTSITIMGTVCTFYVSVGGMRAVIWADTFQLFIMVAGMTAVVIQGSLRVGGITNVFRIAAQGGRMNIRQSVTQFNPVARASLWNFMIGGLFRVNLNYIAGQYVVQRYCTVKTAKDARNVALMTMPLFAVMSTLIGMCGLVMYATYAECDPLLHGDIERRDQLVPHLVIDLLGYLPGIPGLFLSAVFSASLSSMSSGMQSISALILTDIVKPLYEHFKGRPMDTHLATKVAKAIALSAGVVITGAAFMTSALGKSIFAFNALLGGAFIGPASGIIFVALLFPKVRSLFAHVAFIVSISVVLGLGLLAQLFPNKDPGEELPLTTAGCPAENITQLNDTTLSGIKEDHIGMTYSVGTEDWTTATVMVSDTQPVTDIYHLNSLLYGPVGFFLTVFIATGLHMCARMSKKIMVNSSSDESEVSKKCDYSSEDKDSCTSLKTYSDMEDSYSVRQNGKTNDTQRDPLVDDQTISDPLML